MSLPQASTRKIFNYSKLQSVSLPTVNTFATRYSKEYCYVATTQPAIEYPTHALYPKVMKRWETRQEPFWWNVITRKDIENHRTVRSWLSRRLRCAFTESLRKKGYAPNGNRIDGTGAPLTGTAQLFPHKSLLVRPYMDVVYQTDLAVNAIIKIRTQNKRPKANEGGKVQQEKRQLYGKKKTYKAPQPPETPHQHAAERSIKL